MSLRNVVRLPSSDILHPLSDFRIELAASQYFASFPLHHLQNSVAESVFLMLPSASFIRQRKVEQCDRPNVWPISCRAVLVSRESRCSFLPLVLAPPTLSLKVDTTQALPGICPSPKTPQSS